MFQLTKTHSHFPEYKPTNVDWIGDIPNEWECSPLFTVCKENKQKNTGIINTNVLSLSYGKIIRRDIESNFGLLPESFETYQVLENGTIILRLTDLQNDKRSIRVGIAKECGIITSAYIGLNVNKKVFSDYLGLLLRFFDIQKVFYNLGGGVRQSLKFDELKKLPILLPSKPEQEAILNFLEEKTALLDEAIAKKKQQIEFLSEHRTALISNAITKGLDANAEMKDSGLKWIGSINKNWLLEPLKRLVKDKITDGPHTTPDFVEDDENAIPFISVEAIKDSKIDFNYRRGNISQELHKEYCQKCHPRRDDIFLVKSGSTTGKVAMVEVDFEFSVWSPLALVRANTSIALPKFLFYAMSSKIFQNQVQLFWSFGTQPNIGMGVIETLTIPVPNIQEQKEIVDYLDKEIVYIEAMKAKIEQSIELLQEYKTSLISHAVSGKIKVS